MTFGAGFPDMEMLIDRFAPSIKEMSDGGLLVNRGGAVDRTHYMVSLKHKVVTYSKIKTGKHKKGQEISLESKFFNVVFQIFTHQTL